MVIKRQLEQQASRRGDWLATDVGRWKPKNVATAGVCVCVRVCVDKNTTNRSESKTGSV